MSFYGYWVVVYLTYTRANMVETVFRQQKVLIRICHYTFVILKIDSYVHFGDYMGIIA